MSRRAYRWWIWAAVGAAILIASAVGLRLTLLDGWLRTVRIDGPSMAPSLCGTHLVVTCQDCGIRFRCDGEQLPASGRLVCPNCGFRGLKAESYPPRAGDTVLVDRWPLLWRAPKRWEVVAYDDPHDRGAAVKRVVGLPGETISIQGGDLYAGGRIVRKSLAEFWQTATLVYDDAHRPQSIVSGGAPRFLRWRPQDAASRWQPVAGGYRWEAGGRSNREEPDWLEYVHWRCNASLAPRDEPAIILDNDPYNQAHSRRLNEVQDLVLTSEAELAADGQLTVALLSRGTWLQVQFDASRQAITASTSGHPLTTLPSPKKLAGRTRKLTVGHLDAQLVVALDGHEVLAVPLDVPSSKQPVAATTAPRLRIAAAGAVSIHHLQVWCDLYLLEPRGTERDWTADAPLGADEYLVLGDNVPVSIDSRHWKPAGISRQAFRGLIIAPRGNTRE